MPIILPRAAVEGTEDSGTYSNTGVTVAIVIAAIAGVVLIVGAGWWLHARRKARRTQTSKGKYAKHVDLDLEEPWLHDDMKINYPARLSPPPGLYNPYNAHPNSMASLPDSVASRRSDVTLRASPPPSHFMPSSSRTPSPQRSPKTLPPLIIPRRAGSNSAASKAPSKVIVAPSIYAAPSASADTPLDSAVTSATSDSNYSQASALTSRKRTFENSDSSPPPVPAIPAAWKDEAAAHPPVVNGDTTAMPKRKSLIGFAPLPTPPRRNDSGASTIRPLPVIPDDVIRRVEQTPDVDTDLSRAPTAHIAGLLKSRGKRARQMELERSGTKVSRIERANSIRSLDYDSEEGDGSEDDTRSKDSVALMYPRLDMTRTRWEEAKRRKDSEMLEDVPLTAVSPDYVPDPSVAPLFINKRQQVF
ncbi:hypothetical protein CYLTODRAFT_200114 [Cylindrobasidium torrendii FP15055 ss-10]|uniref:Uncharacterized protein n=1 Tax=Cylindrobasidium torrendii FP15055 ss-10 TaxID=1314674 RepID=A0A0D7BIU3_9AGAR|nr:hypothetical protein CYLTODRAFT_200114 [Cylindrobasidium torrendii FP15055 ss-10]